MLHKLFVSCKMYKLITWVTWLIFIKYWEWERTTAALQNWRISSRQMQCLWLKGYSQLGGTKLEVARFGDPLNKI